MRIAIAGFLHESNTFAPWPTTLRHFSDIAIARGEEIFRVWGAAHHEIGGFFEGAAAEGAEIIPVIGAAATPAGPVEREVYESITTELVSGIVKASPDGVLLALHGAMVADHIRDADGETVSRLREALGPDVPIVMTLDLHANVSQRMTDAANATIAYRTNPHVQQRIRGIEAAHLLSATIRKEVQPVTVLRKPPLIHNIACQETSRGPGAAIRSELDVSTRVPGILSASYTPGFYYADVEEMGPGIIVVADGDAERAAREADRLNAFVLALRAELVADLPDPSVAVRRALASPCGPICLLDCGDNIGGGSPGDSTILLNEILLQNGTDSLTILFDPPAVEACIQAGVGSQVSLDVGGKTDDRHGSPVRIKGEVRVLGDGRYEETEPRHGGKRFGNQGPTAVIVADTGNTVVLTSLREAPMSLQQILSLGLEPDDYKVIVVKGSIAPRAAYEPIAADIFPVDTPGVTSVNPFNFEYQHRPKPLYPLEDGQLVAPSL